MKKHSTLERLDLAREIRILALGLIGSLIMAINIKSFVHTEMCIRDRQREGLQTSQVEGKSLAHISIRIIRK